MNSEFSPKALIAMSPSLFTAIHLWSFFKVVYFLLLGVSTGLKIDRAPDRFLIISNDIKFIITKANLHVRKREVNTSVQKANMDFLTKGEPVKYPVTRVKSRFNVINQGFTKASINIKQHGQLHSMMMIHIASLASQTDNLAHSLFSFTQHDLEQSQCT